MKIDYPKDKTRLLAANYLVVAQTYLLQLIKYEGSFGVAVEAFDLVDEAVRLLGPLPARPPKIYPSKVG